MTQKTTDPGSARVEQCLASDSIRASVRPWTSAVGAGDLSSAFDLFYRDILAHARVHPSAAREAFVRVRRAWSQRVDEQQRARLDRLAAHTHRALGDMKRADEAYALAWERFSELGDETEIGRTAIGWLDVLGFQGRFEEARAVAERGRVALARRDRTGRARLESNWGNHLYLSGQLTEAARVYRSARTRLRKAEHQRDAALVSWNLGQVELLRGRVGRAREAFVEAEKIFEERGFRSSQLRCRFGLAVADLMEGRWSEGLRDVRRLQEELETIGDRRAVAAILEELSRVAGAAGLPEVAVEYAQRGHDLYDELGLQRDAAKTNQLLGQWLLELGHFLDARVRLSRATEFFTDSGHHRARRHVEVELAACLLGLGRSDEALRSLQRLRGRLRDAEDRNSRVRCLGHLARAYLDAGRRGWALRTARQAYRLAKRHPENLHRPELAMLCAEACGEDRALTVGWIRRSLRATDERTAEWTQPALGGPANRRRNELYRKAIDLTLSLGGRNAERQALELLSRSTSTRLLQQILQETDDLDRPLRVAISQLRDRLLHDDLGEGEDVRSRSIRSEIESLQRRHDTGSTWTRRARASSLDAAGDLESCRSSLGTDGLVFYDRHGDDIVAYTLDSKGSVKRDVLADSSTILERHWSPLRLLFETAAHLSGDRRRSFLERTRDEASDVLARLRQKLIDPIPVSQNASIHAILAPQLQELPLQAMAATSDGGESVPLVRRWLHPALVQARHPRRTPSRPWAVLLSDGREAPARESDDIRQRLETAGIRTSTLTRREELEGAKAGAVLLHVAAHGIRHPQQWLLNGIRLEDGWLGFEHFERRQFRDALIYLSSCESGLATGTAHAEVEGWMVAGLRAAARELVLTLWKIDDAGARRFAKAFYASWIERRDAAVAVREAQAQLRREGAHPFAWAGFMALG